MKKKVKKKALHREVTKEFEPKMKTKSFFPAPLCTRISSFGLMLLLKEPRSTKIKTSH